MLCLLHQATGIQPRRTGKVRQEKNDALFTHEMRALGHMSVNDGQTIRCKHQSLECASGCLYSRRRRFRNFGIALQLDTPCDVIVHPTKCASGGLVFRVLDVVDRDISGRQTHGDSDSRCRLFRIPVVTLIMRALCWVECMPSGTVKERGRQRVDQVVGRDAEGIDFPEREQVRGTIVDSRGGNLEVGVLGVLAAAALAFSLLDALSALSQTDAAEQLWSAGGDVGTAFTHVWHIKGVAHVGGPAGADLLLHVRGQDVGNEVVTSRAGQDRVDVEGLSCAFRVGNVIVVENALGARSRSGRVSSLF